MEHTAVFTLLIFFVKDPASWVVKFKGGKKVLDSDKKGTIGSASSTDNMRVLTSLLHSIENGVRGSFTSHDWLTKCITEDIVHPLKKFVVAQRKNLKKIDLEYERMSKARAVAAELLEKDRMVAASVVDQLRYLRWQSKNRNISAESKIEKSMAKNQAKASELVRT